jgi:hypothetical protein
MGDKQPLGYVSVNSRDASPRPESLSFEVELEEARISGDSPPVVRIEVSNTSAKSLTIQTEFRPVFGGFKGEANGNELLLLRREEVPQLQEPLRPVLSQIVFDSVQCRKELPPGGSATAHYELWCGNKTGPVFPQGTYRFNSKYRETGKDDDFTWGFSLDVER